jgi:hypothetical protein
VPVPVVDHRSADGVAQGAEMGSQGLGVEHGATP